MVRQAGTRRPENAPVRSPESARISERRPEFNGGRRFWPAGEQKARRPILLQTA